MDFELALMAFLRTEDGPVQFHAEINHEGRPTIWLMGTQYIAVGNSMVPAPTTQTAAPAGFDAHRGMGER